MRQKEVGKIIASVDLAAGSYRETVFGDARPVTVMHFTADKSLAPEYSHTLEQQKKLASWLAEHDKTCPYRINQGATGGRLTSHFTHTGIGCVETVSCACGAEIDLTEYDSW